MSNSTASTRRPLLLGVVGGGGYALACALSFAPVSFWPAALLGLPLLAWIVLRGSATSPVRTAIGAGIGTLPLWAWTHGWVFGVAWPGAVLLMLQLTIYIAAFAWLSGVVLRRWGLGCALILWPLLWSGLQWLRSEVIWGGYAWYTPAQGLIDAPFLPFAAGVVGMHGIDLLLALLAGGMVGCAMSGQAAGEANSSITPSRVKLPVRHARTYWVVGTVGVLLTWCGLSLWGKSPTPDGSPLRVAGVQTVTPQSVRGTWAAADRLETMDLMIDLSRQAGLSRPEPDVIVWPETMFPGDTLAPADMQAEREADLVWFDSGDRPAEGYRNLVWRGRDGKQPPSAITRMGEAGERKIVPSLVCADTLIFWQSIISIPMLIGTDSFDGLRVEVDSKGVPQVEFDARYNSVFLVDGGQVDPESYNKHHLTPFGEVMPGIERWKSVQDWLLNQGIGATGMRFDLSRGPPSHEARLFQLQASDGQLVTVATPICFEGTSPRVCRELLGTGGKRRADILIGVTNDGWFGRWPVGREAHLELTRWRCLEGWAPMVRVANTGISASIDTHGRIVDSLAEWELGLLVAEVRSVSASSPYLMGGYRLAWVSPWVVIVVLVLLMVRPIRDLFQRPKPRPVEEAGEQPDATAP
jgi:apolipoprotein N-acyltransferase